MLKTSVSREQLIAQQLHVMNLDLEGRVPDVELRVNALQVAKLMLTILSDGYQIGFDSFGTVCVTKPMVCMMDHGFTSYLNVVDVSLLSDGTLILENKLSGQSTPSRFENFDFENGSLEFLLAVKDFEIKAIYEYIETQRDTLMQKHRSTDARLSMLETKLNSVSDILSGRRC